MTATITTTENFPAGITTAQMEAEKALRLKAGAITATITGTEAQGWVLTTTWNVLGEQ